MPRFSWRFFSIIIVAVLLASPALAGEKADSGMELFKLNCKVCHGPDSEFGEYPPMSLIMDQWDDFFDETYPATHIEFEVSKPGQDSIKVKLGDLLDKKDIKKLRKFTVDHAADSEEPMTCG